MRHRFHSICPYFAMFPETFVEKHLAATRFDGVVFDPFCGRGTTVFESLIRDRKAAGCDVHAVAVCVSGAKSDPPTRSEVFERLSTLEEESFSFRASDNGGELAEFFSLCFDPATTTRFTFCETTLIGAKSAPTASLPRCHLGRYTENLTEAPTTSAIECRGRSVRNRLTPYDGGVRTGMSLQEGMCFRS